MKKVLYLGACKLNCLKQSPNKKAKNVCLRWWMDDLQFCVLFQYILVISVGWLVVLGLTAL